MTYSVVVRDPLKKVADISSTFSENATVLSIMEQVAKQHPAHPAPDMQRLVFGGRLLPASEQLSVSFGSVTSAPNLVFLALKPSPSTTPHTAASTSNHTDIRSTPSFSSSTTTTTSNTTTRSSVLEYLQQQPRSQARPKADSPVPEENTREAESDDKHSDHSEAEAEPVSDDEGDPEAEQARDRPERPNAGRRGGGGAFAMDAGDDEEEEPEIEPENQRRGLARYLDFSKAVKMALLVVLFSQESDGPRTYSLIAVAVVAYLFQVRFFHDIIAFIGLRRGQAAVPPPLLVVPERVINQNQVDGLIGALRRRHVARHGADGEGNQPDNNHENAGEGAAVGNANQDNINNNNQIPVMDAHAEMAALAEQLNRLLAAQRPPVPVDNSFRFHVTCFFKGLFASLVPTWEPIEAPPLPVAVPEDIPDVQPQ